MIYRAIITDAIRTAVCTLKTTNSGGCVAAKACVVHLQIRRAEFGERSSRVDLHSPAAGRLVERAADDACSPVQLRFGRQSFDAHASTLAQYPRVRRMAADVAAGCEKWRSHQRMTLGALFVVVHIFGPSKT